jgi:hypothetical protein
MPQSEPTPDHLKAFHLVRTQYLTLRTLKSLPNGLPRDDLDGMLTPADMKDLLERNLVSVQGDRIYITRIGSGMYAAMGAMMEVD